MSTTSTRLAARAAARRAAPVAFCSVFLLSLLVSLPIQDAQAQLLSASSDVTLDLVPGASNPLADQDVAVDNRLGLVFEETLGGPLVANPAPDTVGFADEGGGRRLFVLDVATALVGVVASPGDVVRFDGASYEIVLDASAAGVPPGARIDAVTRGPTGDLLVSFDVTVNIDGTVFADEDLGRLTPDGLWGVFFDGSEEGVPTRLDLDAASIDAAGVLHVSFDSDGVVGGVVFADEDVLAYDLATGTWATSPSFDASADGSGNAAAWRAADLDAIQIPEPTLLPTLAIALLALTRIGRHKASAER
ncbi:MAG: hypothetical protein NXI30_10140 [bacterium]|nr:hypothetical protein [bacterium]